MGDRLDRSDDERLDRDRDEEKDWDSPPKPSLFSFFDFNKFLGEVLRLIIYMIIFVTLFFLFVDQSGNRSTFESINQLDSQEQGLGEITLVGNEIVLDEMLVNTADELESHFAKARIVISYGSQETGLEINRRLNQVYDRIRKVVSSKKFSDLKYVDGQELLGLEIKTEIQKITGKIDIYNIFFKDFTVY